MRVVSTGQDDWMSRETSYAVACAQDAPLCDTYGRYSCVIEVSPGWTPVTG